MNEMKLAFEMKEIRVLLTDILPTRLINDPAGNSYWGVLVSLHVKEYSQ